MSLRMFPYGLLVSLKVLAVEIGLNSSPSSPIQISFLSFSLAITTVNESTFNYSNNDALFAMFDGGLNDEVPVILKTRLPDVLLNEYEQCDQANVYLKHTFLSLQK